MQTHGDPPAATVATAPAGFAGRLRGLVTRVLHGGLGAAGAMLLPRFWSAMTQWVLAAAAGAASVSVYVSTISRGAAAVALVASALGPVLGHRKAAMGTASGRALIGGGLVVMATLAFGLTLAFEATLGLGLKVGLFTAIFAAATILQGPAIVAWPLWQVRGRYLPLLAAMLAILIAGTACAVLGKAQLAAIAIAVAATLPCLAMLGRTRPLRAVRYALFLTRKAIPISSMSLATALIYPLCLQRGNELFGAATVGHQVLFWSFALALNIASQSIAARALAAGGDAAKGARRWLGGALGLILVATAIFLVFRWKLGSTVGVSPLPVAMVVSASAFILSDPLCFYFGSPTHRRTVAIGSVFAALLVSAAVLAWPRFMIDRFSVCGPSAIIAALRLSFITDRPVRRYVYGALACLLTGFILSLWVR